MRAKKYYTIVIKVSGERAASPEKAAISAYRYLETHTSELVMEVTDDQTGEKTLVDLSGIDLEDLLK